MLCTARACSSGSLIREYSCAAGRSSRVTSETRRQGLVLPSLLGSARPWRRLEA